MPLAGLASLEVSAPGKKPSEAATYVGSRLEIYVPLAGLIDLKEERVRLTKEIARVDADLESLSKKLDNPNFVAKAPVEVVEKDRARLEELRAKRTKLHGHLTQLSPETRPNG